MKDKRERLFLYRAKEFFESKFVWQNDNTLKNGKVPERFCAIHIMNQYEAYTLSILASGPHSGTVSFENENHKKPMKTKKIQTATF